MELGGKPRNSAFGPAGTRLAVASDDGRAVWDFPRSESIGSPIRLEAVAHSCSAPDDSLTRHDRSESPSSPLGCQRPACPLASRCDSMRRFRSGCSSALMGRESSPSKKAHARILETLPQHACHRAQRLRSKLWLLQRRLPALRDDLPGWLRYPLGRGHRTASRHTDQVVGYTCNLWVGVRSGRPPLHRLRKEQDGDQLSDPNLGY